MEWILSNLGAIVGIVSALCLVAIAVTELLNRITALTKSKKDDEWAARIDGKVGEVINKLERLTGQDLDKDGDVGK